MTIKTCKDCRSPRYVNISYCWKHYREREKIKKEEKTKKKLERKISTKKYQKEITDKLIKINDKLFQEIGRLIYKVSIFGDEYNCLHHYVRKSQSLNTRWDFDNGIPISLKEHCSIHQGQNSEIEGNIILIKGLDWYKSLMIKKHIIITDKQEFVVSENKRLNKMLEKLK